MLTIFNEFNKIQMIYTPFDGDTMLNIKRTESATAPKHFVGGLPASFTVDATNKARFTAALRADKKTYTVNFGGANTIYDAAGFRELGQYMTELADIIEGKVKAA